DHELGARMLLRHLHEVGCRRPAFLAGPSHSHAGQERRLGLEREVPELGLELPPSRVLPCPPTVEGGAKAAREMLARDPEVDALLCFNDLVAAGALQALQELGIAVPREIAVTGYDDIVFARMFTPGLTTIRAPTYELGQQAGRMLIDRMHGRGYGVNIVLQPELVVRGSTAGFSPRAARRRASAARSCPAHPPLPRRRRAPRARPRARGRARRAQPAPLRRRGPVAARRRRPGS